MNSTQKAISAYGRKNLSLRTFRSAEYEVFAQITSRLEASFQKKKIDFPNFVLALHQNRKLWVTLASDVLDADNRLTDQLKAQILYLSEFVAVQTRSILNGKSDIGPLLDVNLSVMRGLTDIIGPK